MTSVPPHTHATNAEIDPVCSCSVPICHSAPLPTADDFYPTDRASHIPHLAACAFNGLFLSPLALPGEQTRGTFWMLLELCTSARCSTAGVAVPRLMATGQTNPAPPCSTSTHPQTGTCSPAGTWQQRSTPLRAP